MFFLKYQYRCHKNFSFPLKQIEEYTLNLCRFLKLLFVSSNVMANYDFKIRDIRIEGLQRVSAGTVFAALPLSVGDKISDTAARNATRALFRTGYFSNIILAALTGSPGCFPSIALIISILSFTCSW